MRNLVAGAVLALGIAGSAGLPAQELSAEDASLAAQTRQSVFRLLAWNMAPMAQMLSNERPFDQDRIALSAERIHYLASMISEAFDADTRSADVDTEARDLIWDNRPDFADKAAGLAAAAEVLGAAVESGERGGILRSIAGVGRACGACHDVYRE